jgi:hypothetical protein
MARIQTTRAGNALRVSDAHDEREATYSTIAAAVCPEG